MKKFIYISITILLVCMTLSAGIRTKVGVAEEFSYSRFNHSPYEASVEFPNRFKTTSIMLDSRITQSLYLDLSDSFSLNFNSGFGFNHSVIDINRFASIPVSINGSFSIGPGFNLGLHGLYLLLGIKSSFFLNNKYWISQIGASFGYIFHTTYVDLSLYVSYWYNTNYRTITTGVGIQFGS